MTSFGNSTLAHRLHTHKDITFHQVIDETESNSRDANCTTRMYMFREGEDIIGYDDNGKPITKKFIERLDYDDGEGMEDPRKLIDP